MRTGLLCVLLLLYNIWPVQSQADLSYYSCRLEELLAIDIVQPDYALLDAAIFHLTNQAGTEQNFPPFRYFNSLHKAAALHSPHMIDLDFCAHYNSIDTYYYFPLDRVREFDKAIPLISENIAEYPLFMLRRCIARKSNPMEACFFMIVKHARYYSPIAIWNLQRW